MSGRLLSSRRVCAVCCQREAQYTCPRCHKAYCSSTCYQRHGQQCTEAFFREQATSQMKATKANRDQQRHMLEILQRLHQQEHSGHVGHDAGNVSSSSDEDEAAGSDTDESPDVRHSKQLENLIKQAAALGDAFEIQPSDLTPELVAELEQLSLKGQLSHLVTPWQPWWTSPGAAELQLNASGQRVIAELVQHEQKAAADSFKQQAHEASSLTAAAVIEPVQLPEPPHEPLPSLSALAGPSFSPSPLLPYQLLQLLVAYCVIMRRYNGEPVEIEGWEAAEQLMSLAPPLSQLLVVPAVGGDSREQQAAVVAPPPESARSACMQLHAAAMRLNGSAASCGDHNPLMLGATADALRILQLGRSCVLLALTDSKRLVTHARQAAKRHLQQQRQRGTKRTGLQHAAGRRVSELEQKHLQQQVQQHLKLAERKLHFFSVWSNEQPGMMYERLSAELMLEVQEQQQISCNDKGTAGRLKLHSEHVKQVIFEQQMPAEPAAIHQPELAPQTQQLIEPQHEALRLHELPQQSAAGNKSRDSSRDSASPVQQTTTHLVSQTQEDDSSLRITATVLPADSGQAKTVQNRSIGGLYDLD